VFINIFIGLAGSIPIAIISALYKKPLLKCIGFILTFAMNGGCLFIALTKAAILGVNKSNDWAFAYITGVLQDIFIL
jgi:hypothetical protein